MTFPVGSAISQSLIRRFHQNDLLPISLPQKAISYQIANCMMTVMGIAAERHGIDLKGATVTIGKEMSSDLPRRIVGLKSVMTIPLPSDHPQRALLEGAAKACPVKQSLSPEIDSSVEFQWVG